MNGCTSKDVRNRPGGETARRALTEYLGRLSAAPDAERNAEMPFNGFGMDFTGANLSGLDLLRAEFSQGSDLQRADFNGSDLYGADFRRARPERASLSDADLREPCSEVVAGLLCVAYNLRIGEPESL